MPFVFILVCFLVKLLMEFLLQLLLLHQVFESRSVWESKLFEQNPQLTFQIINSALSTLSQFID